VELFDSLMQFGVARQLLKHRLRRKFSHTIRVYLFIWFPGTERILLKKQIPTQVAAYSYRTLSSQSL